MDAKYKRIQREIDEVTPQDFYEFKTERDPAVRAKAKPALRRYESAFAKVMREARRTKIPAGGRPAVWLVYNMGLVVKTPKTLFTIDLAHSRAVELAPDIDFAMVTHNHGDHWLESYYDAVDMQHHKTFITSFLDNYRANGDPNSCGGGYKVRPCTFKIKDVEITMTASDHNPYLLDFTTAYELRIGRYTIYHTGDSCNIAKLNPKRRPDLWIMHPYCGLRVANGVAKFAPRLTVIGHLVEMGHPRDKWRWTYDDGFRAAAEAEAAGKAKHCKAVVPLWGERIW